jgi:hypothetical protein
MGMMTFLLPAGLSAEAIRELERACIAGGPDSMPWPTHAQVEGDRLLVKREAEESGSLIVPWQIDGLGRLMGSTATLMERQPPYPFQLELARGKVNQLRCQASDWRAGGLPISSEMAEEIRAVSASFGHALMESASDQAGTQAQAALESSYRTSGRLAQVYMEQVFQVRHQRERNLHAVLGCRLTTVPQGSATAELTNAVNGVCIPLVWSAVEPSEGVFQWDQTDALIDWADAQELDISVGPLVDFSAAQLPEWLWHWERDVQGILRVMASYVSAAVRRYRKRISRWQITTASNSCSVLSLAEDELLWLTVKLVQIARQIDPALQFVVGVAHPWGEYLAVQERTHSPFLFADTLIRSDVNLAALELEIAMGVSPRGSYCRDPMDVSRLLDLYALLGVPLHVTLAYPSASTADIKADPELRVGAGYWRGGFSPEDQADWVASFLPLALCKPSVQAVYWAQYADGEPHQFPHCGLIDREGNAKPALEHFRGLCDQHLRPGPQ